MHKACFTLALNFVGPVWGPGAEKGKIPCRGVVAGRGVQQPGNSKQGQAAKPPVLGPGAKMLEEMRKKGKPIDPKMERMANWMDSFAKDAAGEGAMGEVSLLQAIY